MEREKLLKICNVEGKTLLDIGAGPLAGVAAKDFGCNVTSIDLYGNKLEREREKVKKGGGWKTKYLLNRKMPRISLITMIFSM